MAKVLSESTVERDGQVFKVQQLAPGRGGQSVSDEFFGGRRKRRSKSLRGDRGLQESQVERRAKV